MLYEEHYLSRSEIQIASYFAGAFSQGFGFFHHQQTPSEGDSPFFRRWSFNTFRVRTSRIHPIL